MTGLSELNWDSVRSELDSATTELRAEIRAGFAALGADMRAMKTELITWMFILAVVSWIGTVVPIAGLILRTR